MRQVLKCGFRGSAILALGIGIFGLAQTASAGSNSQTLGPGLHNAAPMPFNASRVDPVLYPHQIVGGAYQVAGKTYQPGHNPNFDQSGTVSWYGAKFHGKLTASGETFNKDGMTAAHPTLPLNSLVKVTNLITGASLVVRINDRGPFTGSAIIDLSEGAAVALGFGSYQGAVRVQYAGAAIPAQTPPAASAAVKPNSILPSIGLPQIPLKAPQAYQGHLAGGDESTVLTIKGPIHNA